MESMVVAILASGPTEVPNGAINYAFRLAGLMARHHETDLFLTKAPADEKLDFRVKPRVVASDSASRTLRSAKFNLSLKARSLFKYDIIWEYHITVSRCLVGRAEQFLFPTPWACSRENG